MDVLPSQGKFGTIILNADTGNGIIIAGRDPHNKEGNMIDTRKDSLYQKNRQLKNDLNYLKLLFETLPNPVFYKDKNGVYIGCNRAFELFFGKDRTWIIGKTVYDMGPRDIADKYHAMDEKLLQAGGTQNYDWKVKTAKGDVRDVIFDKAVLIDDKGAVTGLIGIITDVTENKQSQEALRVSEEKFKKISEWANDAIIQMDSEGSIVFWNKAAQDIFGYTQDEVTGKDLHNLLVPKRYLKAFKKGYQLFRTSGNGGAINKTLELSALRKDGSEFEMELSLSAFKEKNKWHAVGIVRDISDRKLVEKEKEQLIANLKAALDEIKTLKGIVPICSSCKKIRDDKGFWNQLEIYIQEHSNAEFSHGICPDCVQKLYPDYNGSKT